MRKLASIYESEWDFSTCTAADFTIQIDLSKKLWEKWLTRCKVREEVENVPLSHPDYDFKHFMKHEIEA